MISLPPAIQRWITMLQVTQLPQAFGHMKTPSYCERDERKYQYCALGIFLLANGKDELLPPTARDPTKAWEFCKEVLGDEGTRVVCHMNDGEQLTFPALAAWAEVYFSEHGPHVNFKEASDV